MNINGKIKDLNILNVCKLNTYQVLIFKFRASQGTILSNSIKLNFQFRWKVDVSGTKIWAWKRNTYYSNISLRLKTSGQKFLRSWIIGEFIFEVEAWKRVFCRINFCNLGILWKKCRIYFCDPNVLTKNFNQV